MKVVVTGSSSCLAAALLPRLCARPDIEQVTGIDLKPPQYAHARFTAVQCDIRSPEAVRALQDHDALVHLAFIVLRGRTDEREMADVNVRAGHALLLAARHSRVHRIVHLSSAAVYGSGVNLDEDAPLRPQPGFAYAQHKAALETLLARDLPECVRLRPHVILGPHAQPLLRQLLAQPCYLRLPAPPPRLQCVHENDVAQAILAAIGRGAGGPYNLAAAQSFSFEDVIRRRHRLAVPLPRAAARAALSVACRLTGWGGEPAWIDGLCASLTLDCSRAERELNWRPAHDAGRTLLPEHAKSGAEPRTARGTARD